MKPDSRTILLVDDDRASRKLVCAALRLSGYRISESEDVEQARDFLKTKVPGIVLLDIGLGSGDGRELARELRTNTKFDDVPLVAVTAKALEHDEKDLLACGFDYYISKPVNTRYLRMLIEKLVERGRYGGR